MSAARELTMRLGGRWHENGRYGTAPCPAHDDRDPSLSIRDGRNGGIIVKCFAECDWRDIKAELSRRGLLEEWRPGDERARRIDPGKVHRFDREAINHEAERRERIEDDLLRIRRAVEIWEAVRDPRSTLAERYLKQHRALDLSAELAGSVLRFHPSCPWRDENTGRTIYVPALVAAFRSVDDDAITAIHRIALNPDATKIGRRMLGLVHRAAVKLDHVGADLVIGEGIETCMAARQLGIRPGWALGSCGAISFFPILPGVSTLRILGENDEASDRAVQVCGKRWRRAGRRVRVIRPSARDKDLNDVLMRNGAYGRAS